MTSSIIHLRIKGFSRASRLPPAIQRKLATCQCKRGRIWTRSQSSSWGSQAGLGVVLTDKFLVPNCGNPRPLPQALSSKGVPHPAFHQLVALLAIPRFCRGSFPEHLSGISAQSQQPARHGERPLFAHARRLDVIAKFEVAIEM